MWNSVKGNAPQAAVVYIHDIGLLTVVLSNVGTFFVKNITGEAAKVQKEKVPEWGLSDITITGLIEFPYVISDETNYRETIEQSSTKV